MEPDHELACGPFSTRAALEAPANSWATHPLRTHPLRTHPLRTHPLRTQVSSELTVFSRSR